MFWIALLTIALLGSLAAGWMTVQKSEGRLIISLEVSKARQALAELFARGRDFLQHVRD